MKNLHNKTFSELQAELEILYDELSSIEDNIADIEAELDSRGENEDEDWDDEEEEEEEE